MARVRPLLALSRTVSSSVAQCRRPVVLGIETSCDDTAVAIVSADKSVLSSQRFVDRSIQDRFGGIMPLLSAMQHRNYLQRLIEAALDEAGCRAADLDAVAVTTRPGLVICLKTGIEKALEVAREGRIPLVPVHHMRAHALAARLTDEVNYPFVTLLISGGHCIIALVLGPEHFEVLGIGEESSPGECIDKVARSAGISSTSRHIGAEVEKLAALLPDIRQVDTFDIRPPKSRFADFNFAGIKNSYLLRFASGRTVEPEQLPAFCAGLQFHVAAHLCRKLHVAFSFLDREKVGTSKTLVVSGGVAANAAILNAISRISAHHGYAVVSPPGELCSDNGEMIAWAGVEILNQRPPSPSVIPHLDLPPSIYAVAREPIGGNDLRARMHASEFKPDRKLKSSSLLKSPNGRLSFSGKTVPMSPSLQTATAN